MFSRVVRSPSTTLLAACLAVLAGVGAHAAHDRPWHGTALLAAVAAFAASASVRRRSAPRFAALVLAAALLGAWRFDAVAGPPAVASSPPRGAATFTGPVVRAPSHGKSGVRFTLQPADAPPLAVTVALPVDLAEGDVVRATCAPVMAMPFAGRAAGWRCATKDPPFVVARASGMAVWRRRLRATADALMPEPESSMVLGMLVGDRGGIPSDIADAYRNTGTSHLLAVSGFNVSWLARAASFVLALALVRRRHACVAVAALLVLFAPFAGGDPPVVRAAIMGCTGILAELLGRRQSGPHALAFAAACIVLAAPRVLADDVGFRLSFLAVAGLQAFASPIERGLTWIPAVFGLRRAAAETFAATLATLPMIMHDFGTLPPAALLVNMVVVPMVPVVMGAGAVTVAAGAFVLAAGALPALLATASVRAMDDVILFSAAHAPIVLVKLSGPLTAAMYCCLLAAWLATAWPRAVAPGRLRTYDD